MATAQHSEKNISHRPSVAKHHVAHPLCPLTASEISTTSQLIARLWPPKTSLRFKVITLEEPVKKEFLPYLEAEHSGARLPKLDRIAFASYYIRNTVRGHLSFRGGN